MASSSSLIKPGSRGKQGWIPYDIGIMIIDEEPSCLLFIHTMLKTCHYRVESFNNPAEALDALYKRSDQFDLIITDLHTITMPGFRIVESIHQGVKLPVITTCADEDTQLLHQSIGCGACFHIVKPININNLEFVWKKSWIKKARRPIEPSPRLMNFEKSKLLMGSSSSQGVIHMEPSEQAVPLSSATVAKDRASSSKNIDDDKDADINNDELQLMKSRLNWDYDLQKRFMVAISLLGNNVVPSSILGIMNVAGLTTKQVASHLQKYRKHVRKQNMPKLIEDGGRSPTTSASCKRPIEALLENRNEESKDDTRTSNSINTPYVLPTFPTDSWMNHQTSFLDSSKTVRGNLRHKEGKPRQLDANHSKTPIHFHNQSTTNQVAYFPNDSNRIAEMSKKKISHAEFGAITTSQIKASMGPFASNGSTALMQKQQSRAQFGAISGIMKQQVNSSFRISDMFPTSLIDHQLNTHSGTITRNSGNVGTLMACPGTYNPDDPFERFRIRHRDNNLGSLENFCDISDIHSYAFPSIMNSAVETASLLPNVDLATQATSLMFNVDLPTTEVNTIMQAPAFGIIEEWPGLDEFVGLNGLQGAENNEAAAGIVLPRDLALNYDINMKSLNFDDAMLAEMLDDIDKRGGSK